MWQSDFIHWRLADQCVYSAPLCFLAGGIKIRRWLGSIVSGVIASAVLVGFLASTDFVDTFTNYITSLVIWTASWGTIVAMDFFVLQPRTCRRTRAVRLGRDVAVRRHSLALPRRAADRTRGRMGVRVRQRVAVPGSDRPRHQRSGLLVAGVDRVRRAGVLVPNPLRTVACLRGPQGVAAPETVPPGGT